MTALANPSKKGLQGADQFTGLLEQVLHSPGIEPHNRPEIMGKITDACQRQKYGLAREELRFHRDKPYACACAERHITTQAHPRCAVAVTIDDLVVVVLNGHGDDLVVDLPSMATVALNLGNDVVLTTCSLPREAPIAGGDIDSEGLSSVFACLVKWDGNIDHIPALIDGLQHLGATDWLLYSTR